MLAFTLALAAITLAAAHVFNLPDGTIAKAASDDTMLSFLSPLPIFVNTDGWSSLSFNVGDAVNITWRSPFEHTNLEVWQGPRDDGSWAVQTLAVNWTRRMNTLTWEAGDLSGMGLEYPFHFRLQKSNPPNLCDECMTSSVKFPVVDSSAEASSSSSSAMPTSTPPPAAAAATSAAASQSSSSSDSTRLGIGLGVGLGGAFLIALLALLFFFLRRRDRKRQAAQREKDLQAFRREVKSTGTESWISTPARSSQAMSYHERFEFETPDGSVKEGWESLMPSRLRNAYLPR